MECIFLQDFYLVHQYIFLQLNNLSLINLLINYYAKLSMQLLSFFLNFQDILVKKNINP